MCNIPVGLDDSTAPYDPRRPANELNGFRATRSIVQCSVKAAEPLGQVQGRLQCVSCAQIAFEQIVALATFDDVIPFAAVDCVVAGSAVERVEAVAAEDRIVARSAAQ